MTTPALPAVTVTATYLDASGAAQTGSVSFTPGATLRHPESGTVVPAGPVVAALDEAGGVSVELVPTDDPGIAPRGWDYRVVERIGPDADHLTERAYSIRVPTGDGTLDLADIAP